MYPTCNYLTVHIKCKADLNRYCCRNVNKVYLIIFPGKLSEIL